MNYHSRVDEYIGNDGYNQNPSGLAAESTTRNSLNGLVNLRLHKDERLAGAQTAHDPGDQQSENEKPRGSRVGSDINTPGLEPHSNTGTMAAGSPATPPDGSPSEPNPPYSTLRSMWRVLTKYARFIGPGVMISVAYTDP